MKKTAFCIALLALALVLLVSRIILTGTAQSEPSDTLKVVYNTLVNSRAYRSAQAVYADGDDKWSFEASLEDNSIIFTKIYTNEDPISWVFVQDGDWLTAPYGSEEESSRGCAAMLLAAAVSAQGLNEDLFFGYINALTDLQGKYYKESETENKVSVNIVGPYAIEMDVLDSLFPNEEALREQGWTPLREDYDYFDTSFGKIELKCFGHADGVEISVLEYGNLDDLALQSLISAVKVLQPRGWEDFAASYTELKDADEADYTARVNLDDAAIASMEDFFVFQREGYSSAYFSFGQIEWTDSI